ncbi:phosphonate ABC transporter, permease protein PhnE [Halopiger djelfimassiliensis]|uniref:phosphonate ABC transporter, permease protein PhnE n=1 Tax=Halopiger djelfimassiliensis TaxID=1293047 RepID=UPI000677AFAD|nr:phosphonate ABC transporter, permease protein PhnE [Halopiger djelfimassiliensis]
MSNSGVEGTEDVSVGEYPDSWKRPTVFYNERVKYALYVLIVSFVLWSAWQLRPNPSRLIGGIDAAYELLRTMFPPDFSPDARERIWDKMIESIAMSIVATVIGVAISLPIAVMAAENLVPKPVYYVGRALVSISRSLHALVLAIIAVVAVGLGPLAGVIALVIATPGFFAKLLSEELEDIDEGQADAVRAAGGSRLQVLLYGVAPQVVPRMIGLTIYRWDINIRASTIVGIVGAGGIGVTLLNSFDRYEYDFSLAIILAIIAVVMFGEILSAVVRRRVQ